MKPTIAITGATGFVGSHVLEQALAAGFTVHALKRKLRMMAGSNFDIPPNNKVRIRLSQTSISSKPAQ